MILEPPRPSFSEIGFRLDHRPGLHIAVDLIVIGARIATQLQTIVPHNIERWTPRWSRPASSAPARPAMSFRGLSCPPAS